MRGDRLAGPTRSMHQSINADVFVEAACRPSVVRIDSTRKIPLRRLCWRHTCGDVATGIIRRRLACSRFALPAVTCSYISRAHLGLLPANGVSDTQKVGRYSINQSINRSINTLISVSSPITQTDRDRSKAKLWRRDRKLSRWGSDRDSCFRARPGRYRTHTLFGRGRC